MISLKTCLVHSGGLFILVGGLIGCNSLAQWGIAVPYLGDPPLTGIENLEQKKKGTIVYLRGTVGDFAPFLNGGAYQLQDQTGMIWIRTEATIPQKGQEIVVKGQVNSQSILVGSQDIGEVYVEEMEQLEVSTSEPSPTKPSPDPTDELFLPHKQQEKGLGVK